MLSSASYRLRHSDRRPLAVGVASLFALSSPGMAIAGTSWAVTSCDDSGAGTLRGVVATPTTMSGDTVDMSTLNCTITLTTGAITIAQKNLTLHGSGQKQLTISGKNGASIEPDRIINHTYAGTTGHLYIDNLRVGYGNLSNAAGAARGGCIRTRGSLTISHVGVYYCSASATSVAGGNALGGGVYAYAGLTINDSSLEHNTVTVADPNVIAEGGGAMTFGPFDMKDSVVAYNAATGAGRSHGGGISVRGHNSIITGSVIGANSSSRRAGALFLFSSPSTGITTTISNSTITTNNATNYIGGAYINSATINVNNSTIAFNTAAHYAYTYKTSTYFYGAGLSTGAYAGPVSLTLQSTIIASNTAGVTPIDLGLGLMPASVALAGSNNLVRAFKSDVTLPPGQGNLTGVCPLLGPIRDNGGTTYTHALMSGSPAIDAGNNIANDPRTGIPAAYDQRGLGPFTPLYERVSGPHADIGAYEVQQTDIVFDAGFDGCP